ALDHTPQALEDNAPQKTNCSGTLVTPTHVLTAKHCFGDYEDPESPFEPYAKFDDNWIVHFHEHPEVSPITQRRSKAGDAVLFNGRTIDHNRHSDLALVRLHRRVPGVLATPKRPSFVTGSCGNSFTSLYFGYAGVGPNDHEYFDVF